MTAQHAFESDKSSRQERELQLAKRLGDLEYRTEGKFEAEKVRQSPEHAVLYMAS